MFDVLDTSRRRFNVLFKITLSRAKHLLDVVSDASLMSVFKWLRSLSCSAAHFLFRVTEKKGTAENLFIAIK